MTFKVIYENKIFIVEIFTAHNGVEVITIKPGWYIHTELDEAVDAYYDQRKKEKRIAARMHIQQQQSRPFWFRLLKKYA